VQLLADGTIDAAGMISAVEPIARAPEAFALLEDGAGVMKVLIDCREQASR
jgi:(R,R)-butanediol dehydrogenase/meso-butanediol dehydrogenase/diacetyl reductase